MPQYAVKARITGRVQGVAFRAWTRARARSLGLTGWVRNENDNAVSALLQGEREVVRTMLKDLWSGPGAAAVANVQRIETEVDLQIDSFEIRY
ncbi:acylphosphatase [Actibacterium pelagium]|uniref:acylphosphatase n=1 Tax=Actibacterium pelagium TaxID=2029103 RepID=A0A917AAH4_9RHOB|nr:acylphosphatase [Actibacterium pelagium]GGE37414.1 hypothetical protein GCM10011517_01440 [Actibacterium pelagium]